MGVLEEVTQEAYRIAELVEQADSKAASRSATAEAEELRAGVSLFTDSPNATQSFPSNTAVQLVNSYMLSSHTWKHF